MSVPGGVRSGEPFVVRHVTPGLPSHISESPYPPSVTTLDGLADVDGATTADPGTVLVKGSDDVWRPGQVALGGARHFHFTQISASEVWQVTHGLGFCPSGILIHDSYNDIVEPTDIIHVNIDRTDLFFTGRPMSGYCDVS